jgi:hypothetical protein
MKSNLKIQTLTLLLGFGLGSSLSQAAVMNLIENGELDPCAEDGTVGGSGGACALFVTTWPPITSIQDSSVHFENEEAQARLAAEVMGAAEPFLITRLAGELGVKQNLVKKSILILSQKELPLTRENILLQIQELVGSQK